jgi:hypothetical protein
VLGQLPQSRFHGETIKTGLMSLIEGRYQFVGILDLQNEFTVTGGRCPGWQVLGRIGH